MKRSITSMLLLASLAAPRLSAQTPSPAAGPSAIPTPSPFPTVTPQGYHTPEPIYVPDDYSTIQAAIGAAAERRTVIVRNGTYTGAGNYNLDFGGKELTLRSENGPEATIIDAESNGRGFVFQHDETANAVVEGFTIRGGLGQDVLYRGGGILCEGSASPLIADCIITGNESLGDGGGVFCGSGSQAIFRDCAISGNGSFRFATLDCGFGRGGGVFAGSGVTFENCRIQDNIAKGTKCIYDTGGWAKGGGVYGSPLLLNCTITRNSATGGRGWEGAYPGGAAYGGGIYGSPLAINCLIADNTATGGVSPYGGYGGNAYGGGVNGSPTLVSCTVAGNAATGGSGYSGPGTGFGGGVFSAFTANNSIVWGNAPAGVDSSSNITYSDVEGGFPGTHNIDQDPVFLAPSDYRLYRFSPVIDAGSNAFAEGDSDLEGNPRILDGGSGAAIIDMGPYEYVRMNYLIDEGFDDFDVGRRPQGWTFVNCNQDSDASVSSGMYGTRSPAILLNAAGDAIVSCPFSIGHPQGLTFWFRGVYYSSIQTLRVECSGSSDWFTLTELAVLTPVSTSAGPYLLDTNVTQLRFALVENYYPVALDDVRVAAPVPSPTSTPYGWKTPSPPPIPSPTAIPSPIPSASSSPSPAIPTPTPSPSPGLLPTPVYLVLASGDYDGDGTSDVALFHSGSGLWAVRDITRTHFGTNGDWPVSGDYDGDGTTDIGVFRRDSGLWAVQDISRAYFGSSLDRPVPADYDGDRMCDAGVFRDNSGMWAIREITRICFGTQWDLPAPGDFNGDGTGDIAVVRGDYRPGFWAIRGISRFSFWQGGYGYIPQPGDYDGDGSDEAAVYGQIEGLWMVRDITYSFWGRCCDSSPSGADYNGDGLRDIGIFNEAGRWAVSGITRCWFGSTGDIPVTR